MHAQAQAIEDLPTCKCKQGHHPSDDPPTLSSEGLSSYTLEIHHTARVTNLEALQGAKACSGTRPEQLLLCCPPLLVYAPALVHDLLSL